MAHLYPHKHFGWQVIYRLYFPDGTAKRKWRYYHNKARAQHYLQDIEQLEYRTLHGTLARADLTRYANLKLCSPTEAEHLLGRPIHAPTLQVLADEFLARSAIECRPRSHAANKIRVNHLLEYFAKDLPTTEISRNKIESYRGERLKVVSATTVNKEIIKLAQLLDIAVERGAMAQNPARKIKRLRDLRERKPRALTKDEISRLLAAAKAEKRLFHGMAYPIIATYLYTGMRREELVWLEWEDVDLKRRRITIQAKTDFVTKSGKARVVGISTRLAKIAARIKRDGRYVFGGASPLMKGDGIGHAFKKLAKKAGLPSSITLHSLRHTYITHLMEAGVNPRRVQELAGHKIFETTWRYSHVLPTTDIAEDALDF